MPVQIEQVDLMLLAFPPIGGFIATIPLALHGRKQGWSLGMQFGVPLAVGFVFLVLSFVDSAATSIVASFAIMFSMAIATVIYAVGFLRRRK